MAQDFGYADDGVDVDTGVAVEDGSVKLVIEALFKRIDELQERAHNFEVLNAYHADAMWAAQKENKQLKKRLKKLEAPKAQ